MDFDTPIAAHAMINPSNFFSYLLSNLILAFHLVMDSSKKSICSLLPVSLWTNIEIFVGSAVDKYFHICPQVNISVIVNILRTNICANSSQVLEGG